MSSDAPTAWEAITTLLPLIGTGGLTAVLIAYLGTWKPAAKADEKKDAGQVGLQSMLADYIQMEKVTTELKRVGDGLESTTHALNRICDRIDMVSMWKKMQSD